MPTSSIVTFNPKIERRDSSQQRSVVCILNFKISSPRKRTLSCFSAAVFNRENIHFERCSFANYHGFPYSVRFSICGLKFLERYKRDNSILWPMKFFLFESFYSFLETRRCPACFFFLSSFFYETFLLLLSSLFLLSSFVLPSVIPCSLCRIVFPDRGLRTGKGRFSKEGWEILTSKTYFRGIHGFGSARCNEICPVRLYCDFHHRVNNVTSHFNF